MLNIVAIGYITSIVLGIWQWKNYIGTFKRRRLPRTLLPLISWTVICSFAYRILETPQWVFNGTRLAPSFLLKYGQQLYHPINHGPVLERTYTPLTALFYLSATFCQRPNSSVLVASSLTVVSA